MYGAIVKITFSRIFNAMVNGNDFKAKKKKTYIAVFIWNNLNYVKNTHVNVYLQKLLEKKYNKDSRKNYQ